MRYLFSAALLLAWWPAMAAPPPFLPTARPAVSVAPSGGEVVLRLDSAYTWRQAVVEPIGSGRWRIVWAASDGHQGGVWQYTLTLDAPSPDPGPEPDPDPDPKPDPNPYVPDERWQAAVRPILAYDLDRRDASNLALLYGTAGSQAAAGALQTTLELRQYLVEHGTKLGLQGKYPGLGDAVDKVMADALGLDVVKLSDHAPGLLQTLAWAVWEAGQ